MALIQLGGVTALNIMSFSVGWRSQVNAQKSDWSWKACGRARLAMDGSSTHSLQARLVSPFDWDILSCLKTVHLVWAMSGCLLLPVENDDISCLNVARWNYMCWISQLDCYWTEYDFMVLQAITGPPQGECTFMYCTLASMEMIKGSLYLKKIVYLDCNSVFRTDHKLEFYTQIHQSFM